MEELEIKYKKNNTLYVKNKFGDHERYGYFEKKQGSYTFVSSELGVKPVVLYEDLDSSKKKIEAKIKQDWKNKSFEDSKALYIIYLEILVHIKENN
ncbi:hypothetical protein [Lactobacillus sp.]|uniref:hypothetical protein n=1 Tax=Lactobacillus sp. TaxID=1591 RepID=UPI001998D2C1|nr:hypothetical protein [Lactobacillus sp.]MBD5430161.1 hypothetical protein [Lactobacillus sp.]